MYAWEVEGTIERYQKWDLRGNFVGVQFLVKATSKCAVVPLMEYTEMSAKLVSNSD